MKTLGPIGPRASRERVNKQFIKKLEGRLQDLKISIRSKSKKEGGLFEALYIRIAIVPSKLNK